jgi:hypothetical protein
VPPEIGADAQYDSFKWHVENAMNCDYSIDPNDERIIEDVVEEAYKPARWNIPDGWNTVNYQVMKLYIIYVIGTMMASSSLGFPLNQSYGQTIGEFIEKFGIDFAADIVLMVVVRWLETGEMIRHPIAFFIKREGHSQKKADLKRWRLIWPSSFVDQVIQRMMWLPSVDAERRAGPNISAYANGGIKKGGSNMMMVKILGLDKATRNATMMTRDLSSFDFTVNSDVIRLDREARWRLCNNYDENNENHVLFKMLFDYMYAVTYKGEVMLSDGTVYEQQYTAIQRSGVFITYSLNSRQSVRLHQMIRWKNHGDKTVARVVVAGDDAWGVEDKPTDEKVAREVAESYGHVFKELRIGTVKETTFCSHYYIWSEEYGCFVGAPANLDKQVWNLTWKEDDSHLEETLESYLQNYAFSDEARKQGIAGYDRDWWNEFKKLMDELNYIVPQSRRWYKSAVHVGV